ncbi:MAG: 4Fe-4S dicluster domain-containing protein [Candidatus Eisenbacteria sp.]|nr:4Fe-4S dicluster domain-containing protein [Candidatus Eisenbacteria bacterium]
MQNVGCLVDSTRCTGCRGCMVACKQWNELPAEKTQFFGGEGYQNPKDLSGDTYMYMSYHEFEDPGSKQLKWVFGRHACMHCLDPGCVSACPVGALVKTPEGPVTYDAGLCLGCRYCMLACPWDIPKFEWSKALPEICKCTLCADRIAEGLAPACMKACPTGALLFGERDQLLAEARKRMKDSPGKYNNHIYGENEAGGTSLLYISDVPFSKLKLPEPKDVGTVPRPHLTAGAMSVIPAVIVGLSAILGGTYAIARRRGEVEKEAAATGGDQS